MVFRKWKLSQLFVAGLVLFGFSIFVSIGAVLAQEDGVHTKYYDTGGVYTGEFLDGLQHGQGIYNLPNGYKYTGEWIEGRIEGVGKATYPNGSIYEGDFINGRPDGQGMITFADGGTYEGGWLSGKIHGDGVANYANGVRYEGQFEKAVHHGFGVMTGRNGYQYEGEWFEGTKQGLAIVNHTDGAMYAGGFLNGERHGKGLIIFRNNVAQFGNWIKHQTSAAVANTQNVLPILKNAFYELDIEQRKIIQKILKDSGYYNSTIDGMWGRNTLWAFARYAIKKNQSIDLDEKGIVEQLLASIVSETN